VIEIKGCIGKARDAYIQAAHAGRRGDTERQKDELFALLAYLEHAANHAAAEIERINKYALAESR